MYDKQQQVPGNDNVPQIQVMVGNNAPYLITPANGTDAPVSPNYSVSPSFQTAYSPHQVGILVDFIVKKHNDIFIQLTVSDS